MGTTVIGEVGNVAFVMKEIKQEIAQIRFLGSSKPASFKTKPSTLASVCKVYECVCMCVLLIANIAALVS